MILLFFFAMQWLVPPVLPILDWGRFQEQASVFEPPSDWQRHEVCRVHLGQEVCIDLFDLKSESQNKKSTQGVALFIPGFFTNATVFDLWPERNISYARFLQTELGLKVWFLHVRGMAKRLPRGDVNLDGLASIDLPLAIDTLAKWEHRPVIVFGHSQGSITLQASLAGLTPHGFDIEVAQARQKNVRAAILLAGNVSMHGGGLRHLGRLDKILAPLIRYLGVIPARTLTTGIAPVEESLGIWCAIPWKNVFSGKRGLWSWNLWEDILHLPNIDREVLAKWYRQTTQMTMAGILLQFAEGVQNEGIVAHLENGQRVPYSSGLKNINIPVLQMTFELDPMAVPSDTRQGSFDYIGSANKKFVIFDNQGHEDFLITPRFYEVHANILRSFLAHSIAK